MSKLKLLEFQQRVVEKGIKCLKEKKSFVFQSPTGTGKTFISSNLLNAFIESLQPNEEYSFLHFSPSTGQLNEQNAIKFEEYRTSANLTRYKTWKLTSTKQMTIGSFEKNTIHFFGWDSLIKKTNTVTGEMERGSWYDVLTTTLNKGVKIVIVIDEQHINKNSKQTDSFINEIVRLHEMYFNEEPIRIEMSATVDKKDREKLDHRVYYSEAKEEELVKKGIIINKDLTGDVNTENEVLIHSAINKREQIIEAYNKRNLQKKGKLPLLVIQLPDGAKTKGDITLSIENTTQYVLSHPSIHENHVAVWISGRHETLDGTKIEKSDIENNEDISILIFKQAVATGWDIPRANIWVKLRNNMDKAFETQTLGRVLRNQFRKYYNNELIDNAFIYTNDQNVKDEIQNTFGEDAGTAERRTISKKPEIIGHRKDKLAIIEYNFDEVDVDEVLDNIINQTKNLPYIEKIKNEIISNGLYLEEWSATLKLGGQVMDEDDSKDLKTYAQTSFGDDYPLTLYKRWFEYKISLNSEVVEKVLDTLIKEWAEQNPDVRVTSRAYKYFWQKNGDVQQLINDIKEIFRNISVNKESYNVGEFTPKEEVDIFKNYINFENIADQIFDNNMFYNTSLNIDSKTKNPFDSNVEREFYKDLMNPLGGISKNIKYFLYNQVDAKQYYYISYIDKDFRVRKYFPDFIVVKDDTIFILDTKTYDGGLKVSGGESSEHKMDVVNEYLHSGVLGQYTDKKVKFGYVYKRADKWYVVRETKKEDEAFSSMGINEFMGE